MEDLFLNNQPSSTGYVSVMKQGFLINSSDNTDNCLYWNEHNPLWIEEVQYPEKLKIWVSSKGNAVMDPFFIDGKDTYSCNF